MRRTSSARFLAVALALVVTTSVAAQAPEPKLEIASRVGDFYWVVETAPDGSRRGGWVNVQVPLDRIDRAAFKPLPATTPKVEVRPVPPTVTTSRPTPQRAPMSEAAPQLTTPVRPSAVPTVSGQAPRMKEAKLRGYVTEFRSPTDFEIEDYRITREAGFVLDFENVTPDVTFQLQDIRIGVELEIKGLLNEQTGELKAKSIKVDMEQFKPIKQTAFVSVAPEGIQLLDGTWAGELRADGQVIRVTNATAVVFKPTRRERKLAAERNHDATAPEEDDEFEVLRSLDQVTVGMAMTYEGTRDRETGTILAKRVEFATNDLEDGEAKMWRSLKTSIKAAQGLKPGELKIDQIGRFKLLPDDEVQRYVASVGRRLIPSYIAEMNDDDPRKIPFQVHVVVDDQVNAFATPNGIVVVNSGLLELLENEAQLAAVIGHEIAHATQEHTWRQQQYHKKKRIAIALAGAVAGAYGLQSVADLTNMVNGAIVNGHQRELENQSDRVGLQYMVAAGYDPRQAPAVWKVFAKKNGVSSTNFFWSSHDNEPTRRSYLMNELKNNYRDLDMASLRTNAGEYSQIRAAVARAVSKKRRVTVK